MNIADIPVGSAPKALDFPFFPAKHLAGIWHNWNLVPPSRIAAVLETSEENVISAGESMGLVRDDSKLELFASRGYQTIIRTNWHLLDYEQMLQLRFLFGGQQCGGVQNFVGAFAVAAYVIGTSGSDMIL